MPLDRPPLPDKQAPHPEVTPNPEYLFASRICQILQNAGQQAYFAGGYCRDLLLGKKPKDIDVATSSPMDETVTILQSQGIYAKPVPAQEAYPIVIANHGGINIEIATFRQDVYEPAKKADDQGQQNDQAKYSAARRPTQMLPGTLETDAARRDLTINALYYDPVAKQYLDPNGTGLNDIQNKIIRFIGQAEERINEDLVRVLRAVRFKNRLGFQYDPSTDKALADHADQVNNIGPNRRRDEITKMLLTNNRVEAIQDLDRLGMLSRLLPAFTAGKGVEQPVEYHSEGDVFQHQLLILEKLNQAPDTEPIDEEWQTALVWAALLHDIGKPSTVIINKKGQPSFPGHDQAGAAIAKSLLWKDFLFAQKDILRIIWLIENHMRLRDIGVMKRSKQLELLTHPGFPSLLRLVYADDEASLRPEGQTDHQGYQTALNLYNEAKQEGIDKLPTIKDKYGISGRDFLARYNIKKPQQQRLLGSLIDYLNDRLANAKPGEMTCIDQVYAEADAWWGKYGVEV